MTFTWPSFGEAIPLNEEELLSVTDAAMQSHGSDRWILTAGRPLLRAQVLVSVGQG